MHLIIINIISWFQFILSESIMQFYEHTLHEILHNENNKNKFPLLADDANMTDCYDHSTNRIKAYTLELKGFMVPASIEFSITCATIFLIAWTNIGKRNKNLTLPPMKEDLEGVGKVKIPLLSLYVMLDCSKTSRGLFHGVLIVTFTFTMFVLCLTEQNSTQPRFLSEITETTLLLISLLVTSVAYYKIKKHYSKVVPVINMFDVVLIIVGLCGIISYNVNTLISLCDLGENHILSEDMINDIKDKLEEESSHIFRASDGKSDQTFDQDKEIAIKVMSILNAIIGVVQGTLQTAFILECLRRFALNNKQFFRKPGRDLIIFLLSK